MPRVAAIDCGTNSIRLLVADVTVREDGSPFPHDEHPATLALRTGAPQSSVTMGVPRQDGGAQWLSINARPLPRTVAMVGNAKGPM